MTLATARKSENRPALLHHFDSFPLKIQADNILDSFITSQARLCDEKGYRMVVAGDTSSYCHPVLDHLSGPTDIRQQSLEPLLSSLGLRDSF